MHRRVTFALYAAFLAAAVSACGGNGSTTPPTFVVSGLGTPAAGGVYTLDAATTYTFTAKETASGGGAVTPGTLIVTVDNAAIGTPGNGTLVTGTVNATGHVKIVDSKTGRGETLTVKVLSTHPATVGDTITLAGVMTHTIARPLPAPSAIAAPTTTTTNVTDVLTIASLDATLGSDTGLTDEHVVETDAAPLQTITTTSDAYVAFVASAGLQDLLEAGSTSVDSNGVQDETLFGSGAGLLDELPDKSGATFSNTDAVDFSEAEPDGTTIARTGNADGTYAETDTFVGGSPQTIATNADLSAALTNLGGLPINVAFGAPSAAGASGTIPYTITINETSPATVIAGTTPNWMPTATIFSDTSAKTTSAPISSTCKVPSSVGTSATVVTETYAHLDTALGTYETRTQKAYNVPGYGTVCTQLADEIDAYYDYTGQSPALIPGINLALSATPIQKDTISETVGFTTGTVADSSTDRRSAQSVGLSTATALHAVTPIFDRAVESVYRARRDAMARNINARKAALAKEFAR